MGGISAVGCPLGRVYFGSKGSGTHFAHLVVAADKVEPALGTIEGGGNGPIVIVLVE